MQNSFRSLSSLILFAAVRLCASLEPFLNNNRGAIDNSHAPSPRSARRPQNQNFPFPFSKRIGGAKKMEKTQRQNFGFACSLQHFKTAR